MKKVLNKNLLFLVSKIHKLGNDFIINELKKFGLKNFMPSHGDILFNLYKKNGMTIKNIAEKINKKEATLTILINKLEKFDFVKREKSLKDSRYTKIFLTEKGKNFKPIFKKISKGLNKLLYKNLSIEEALFLEKTLNKIIL